MSKLMSLIRRAPKRFAAGVTMVAAAIIVPAVAFAWGPDRPTFTIAQPADYVTFNSITDNPVVGDERNFVVVKDAANTSDGGWQDNITVQPGKEYLVRVYVHNNAAANLNLVAQNTRVMASVPNTTGKNVSISGFVTADNAQPNKIWDDIHFNSTQDFNLTYVAGSAEIYNNGYAAGGAGKSLPDSIVTSTGAKVGYNGPDGKVPGCFEYVNYVYFKVKPQFPKQDFTVTKDVRKAGDTSFVQSVATNPGADLNYRITYKNTGNMQQNDVILKDTLPAGVSYVPGSVKIMNANNPSGAFVADGDKLFSTGINIGSYTAGSNALVIFNAKVKANDQLPTCGPNTLKNIASAQPYGQTAKQDDALVTTNKECKPEDKDIKVCELATKKIVTIKESQFDSSKYSKNLDDCKTVIVKEIKVCDLETKKIITIKENEFDSSKHSTDLKDCDKIVVKDIEVCELATKKIVTIKEDAFDESKYSKDLSKCEETPVTPEVPTELPTTGVTENVAAIVGLGALIASAAYYIASRRALNQ